jgi:hypothetical protein
MLELAKLIHHAIGIESPRKFIAVCAIVGLVIFGCLGWLIDKGYRAKLGEQTKLEAPQKASGNASATGDQSTANTGDGNSFNNDQSPPPKK